MMDLIYITSDVEHAQVVEAAGVDRVMVDLEINGKIARQGHLNTVISGHTVHDVEMIRSKLTKADLLVRVNPIFDGSKAEIDECIKLGADQLMLPMFTSEAEVEQFLQIVNGRVRTCLLLETPPALARIHSILNVPSVQEFHIGLNDLHLGLGLQFMFELLSGGLVDYCAQAFNRTGVHFGFGGISRLGLGRLPSNLVLSEHVRMGSKQVILSRDFRNIFEDADCLADAEQVFRREVSRIRDFVESRSSCDEKTFCEDQVRLQQIVRMMVDERKVVLPKAG